MDGDKRVDEDHKDMGPQRFRHTTSGGELVPCPSSLAASYNSESVVSSLPTPQAYIPKRRTLIQVLPPANAYTKSAHEYMHEKVTKGIG